MLFIFRISNIWWYITVGYLTMAILLTMIIIIIIIIIIGALGTLSKNIEGFNEQLEM